MTRYQTNRLARRACITLIKWGWNINLDKVKRAVDRSLLKNAKSNSGEGKTKSEMAKEILLSMGDKLSYADNYEYYFGKLFSQIYKAVSLDDKAQKTRA